MSSGLVTIAIPSLNQGRFLNAALESIFLQGIPVEVAVLDGGSVDGSIDIIRKWEKQLVYWRTAPDKGQSVAINEGIRRGTAPYVCWLNADDAFLPGGLNTLVEALQRSPECPAAYGKCWTINENGRRLLPFLTTPFSSWLLSNYCFIAQPACLVRRSAWEAVEGVDESLDMALDYDLWWRLYRHAGAFHYVRRFVAATRMHRQTKTTRRRADHYMEAMEVVRRHTGKVPLKWYASWPFMVTLRSFLSQRKL